MNREKNSFWAKKTRITLDANSTTPGFYELSVVTACPCYAELHLYFDNPTRGPAVVQLELAGERRFLSAFRIDSPCRRAELHFSPPINRVDVTSYSLRRLTVLRSIRLGLDKFLKNIRNPGSFFIKLRHIVSGRGFLTIRDDRRNSWSRAQAYDFWRQAFESPYERERLLSTLAELGAAHSHRALFVYAASAATPEALTDFLNTYEARAELPYSVNLLVIQGSGPGLPKKLLRRVRDFKGKITSLSGAGVPLDIVSGYAKQCGSACVIFLERGGRFHELAVPAFLLAFGCDNECKAVYADNDQLLADGARGTPRFNPDWSYEYFLSFNYIGAPVAFRNDPRVFPSRRTLNHTRALSYELMLLLAAKAGKKAIHHIPRVLFHERADRQEKHRRKRQAAEADAVNKTLSARYPEASVRSAQTPEGRTARTVRYPAGAAPLTSVMIPTRDNPKLLRAAAESVLDSRYPNLELLILDNGSKTNAQKKLLSELSRDERVRIVSLPMKFNYSRLNNLGARESSGEILILLNDDTKALTDGWIEELVSLAVQPEVGCVGPLLLYGDRTVQHAGVVLGLTGVAGHPFRHVEPGAAGMDLRLHVRHEVSAVTGACLAVRKSLYNEAGGLREDLAVDLNDIDFCLRLRAQGYRNLYTPHARLLHFESASRGTAASKSGHERAAREQAAFLETWGVRILDDPFYSPNLSRTSLTYQLRFEG